MPAEPFIIGEPQGRPSLGGNQPPATPQATQPQRGHAPPISHSPCTFLSLGCPHGQSGCNSLPFVPRGGAPGIILTGSRLLRTAPRAAQSPPKVPTSLSNSVVMSTEALGIIRAVAPSHAPPWWIAALPGVRIHRIMACIWSIVSDGSEVQLNGNC